MTPVFCCGFECGQAGNVGQHWSALGTGWSFSTSTVRSGARSIRYNPSAANSTITGVGGTSGTTKVWRVYIRFATLPSADCILSWFDYGGSSAGIGFKSSDSKLYSTVEIATVNTFGATGVTVTTGVWYRVDVRTVGDLVTGTSDIRVDGAVCGQATGAFASANATNPNFGSNAVNISGDIFFDDFVFSETSGDYPIGAGYVNHFVPTSDGTHSISGAADFRRGDTTTDILNSTTTAYQLVDDVPLDDVTPDTNDHIRIVAPANAADYVECVYGPAPGISTPTVAPRAVEVIAEFFAAGTGLSDEIFKVGTNVITNEVWNGVQVAGTTSGIYKRKHYPLSPFAQEPWEVTGLTNNFNIMRFRYGYATDANPDKSLMCTMIEAEFEEIILRQPFPTSIGHPFFV